MKNPVKKPNKKLKPYVLKNSLAKLMAAPTGHTLRKRLAAHRLRRSAKVRADQQAVLTGQAAWKKPLPDLFGCARSKQTPKERANLLAEGYRVAGTSSFYGPGGLGEQLAMAGSSTGTLKKDPKSRLVMLQCAALAHNCEVLLAVVRDLDARLAPIKAQVPENPSAELEKIREEANLDEQRPHVSSLLRYCFGITTQVRGRLGIALSGLEL